MEGRATDERFGERPSRAQQRLCRGCVVRSRWFHDAGSGGRRTREGLQVRGGRGWQTQTQRRHVEGCGPVVQAALGTGFPDWRKRCLSNLLAGGLGFSDARRNIVASAASNRVEAVDAPVQRSEAGMIVIAKSTAATVMHYGDPGLAGIAPRKFAREHPGDAGGVDVIGSSYNRATQAFASRSRQAIV